MRSQDILSDRAAFSINRAVYKSMGYGEDDLERPIIGIANAWSTLVPGHYNLRQMAEAVREGIYRGGCTAVEFGTIGVCDGTAQGHSGMHYVLPSRELIADSIETMAEAHRLDGLVCLGSCDKIVPGMLMAAARLDIPCIHLPGGPMLGGVEFDGRKADLTSTSEAAGMLNAGKIDLDTLHGLEETCCSSCGSCSFYGTANTMCVLSEALGMSLPGAAVIPAPHPARIRMARTTGEAVCRLVREGITSRRILTREALENAVKVCLATSGSTNAVLHLSAIAHEAELPVSVIGLFETLDKETPVLVKVNPASSYDMEDFYRGGGVPRVMQNLGRLLNRDVMTVTGKSLHDNLESYAFPYPEDRNIIRRLDEPFQATGGLTVLRGNLAPGTGISKPGAIDPAVRQFTGTARTFDCEEDAEQEILAGHIAPGTVVVIRYEGPKGGPGMREMYKAMKYLNGMGLAKSTALITDGRFSGTNNGCFVGHISPEAAEGGPIAAVRDGDQIQIDTLEGRLTLLISQEELEQRLLMWKPRPAKYRRGYLSVYARHVSSADEGAIIKYGSEWDT